LIDVPVSISVWSAESLQDQGIITQDELFGATVGIDYSNFGGGRGGNNPGVRGVQSDLRAANQQKVASFVDGMPMQGNQGNLQFSGIDTVEIYRGPQSAAFGRSTFAGAINYVTSDASEEFEGKVQVRVTDQGNNEVGALISGPLGGNLGYRVSYLKGDNSGPDEWTSTDGTEIGSQETDVLSAKLNFRFSETAYGEVMYNRLETFDQGGASFVSDPSLCNAGSGIWRNNMGADVELPSGEWNCSTDVPNGAIPRHGDVLRQFLAQYDANIGFYTMAAMMADRNMNGVVSSSEYLAQTFADGQTYEQALLGHTITQPGTRSIRDRFAAELNFEIGDGLLQVLGMRTEDGFEGWNENDRNDTHAVFTVNMMTMLTALSGNVMSMGVVNEVEETYFETRWISSGEERFRYTLSGSYYDYSLQQQVDNNFGAKFHNLTLPNGTPVDANSGITISEVATNIGASFGLQYDLSDSTTLSLEGRYQVDEVCGQDANGANVEFCQETTAFLPRLAITHAMSDNRSLYGQVSVGNNPAGVNIAYQDPGNILALQVASGQVASPIDGFTYNGADGVHFAQIDYDATTFPDFEEEKLYNFEIGSKGTYADGRGAYTAAVYFMIYENIIGAENLNWDNTDTNGWNESNWTTFTGERTWLNQGDGEMYGIELDTSFALNEIWQVGGYLTLSSSKYTDFCSIQAPQYRNAPGGAGGGGSFVIPILTPEANGVNSACGVVDGNWIPKQAPITANLNISANLPNDIFGLRTNFRADIRHKGSYYEDHLNLTERSAVTTVNLSANMRNENWNVRLFVNNLTDNRQPNRIAPDNLRVNQANPTVAPPNNGSWQLILNRPREIGLQVGYNF
jgi:iron complex outermembrane recepter protein